MKHRYLYKKRAKKLTNERKLITQASQSYYAGDQSIAKQADQHNGDDTIIRIGKRQ